MYLKHGNGLRAKAWTTVAFITISPVTSVQNTAQAGHLFRDLIFQQFNTACGPKEDNPSNQRAVSRPYTVACARILGIDA